MRVTVIQPQTKRKRLDRPVRRTEKQGRRASTARSRGSIRPIRVVSATADTARGKKRLIGWPRWAILRSNGKLLGECRITGRERQLSASRQQLELIAADLAVQEELLAKGLTENARLSALRREAARLDGEIGELEAGIAEARSAVAGFEVERLRLRATFIETAQGELRNLQPKEAELRERIRVLEARVDRLVLRAPMDGTVLGLQLHTIGGVVPAGGEIAAIVPSGAPLVLSVQLDPAQIDRVHAGQSATIRFPNFNARITPEVDGVVTTVSGDTITDTTTGRTFYTAELALVAGAETHLNGQTLVPGMPVEAFIRTDARSPASFLLKPLADYWTYAMREE